MSNLFSSYNLDAININRNLNKIYLNTNLYFLMNIVTRNPGALYIPGYEKPLHGAKDFHIQLQIDKWRLEYRLWRLHGLKDIRSPLRKDEELAKEAIVMNFIFARASQVLWCFVSLWLMPPLKFYTLLMQIYFTLLTQYVCTDVLLLKMQSFASYKLARKDLESFRR